MNYMNNEFEFYIKNIMVAIPLSNKQRYRMMVFVDGENLSIRYKEMLEGQDIPGHVEYEKDIYVWSNHLNHLFIDYDVIRKYYYTSVTGDNDKVDNTLNILKRCGMEEPKIFKKPKGRHSKGVDIALATDMLTHAHKKNYEVAILVAGDGDYAPLVEAVKNEGCRVFVWFFKNGLNKKLEQKSDAFWNIGNVLLESNHSRLMMVMANHGL